MDKIGIFINSAGRAGNVKTVLQFPDSWKMITRICVPKSQYRAYKKAEDWPVLAIDDDVPDFLPAQRQWVMENAECKYVWLMDDDLTFMWRNDKMRLKKSGRKNMQRMMEAVLTNLKEVPIVGISTRNGNNHVTDDSTDITRVTRCYAIRRKIFNKLGVSFTPTPFDDFVAEDFHVNLMFLKHGHRNRVLYNFAQGDSGSNADGGCSEYRDEKVQRKTSLWMEEHHPGIVRAVMKKTKSSWKGFAKDDEGYVHRLDMVIAWKKAFKMKRNKDSGISKFL